MGAGPLGCGHLEHIQAQRARVIAHNPQARDRILGLHPALMPSKSHRIIVDLRAGTRQVETIFPEPPAPIIVVEPNPPQPVRAVVGKSCWGILEAVCAAWEVKFIDLQGPGRFRRLALPRFACFQLMRDSLGWSTVRTGKFFTRDHTTVLSGLSRAVTLYEHDADWRQRFDAALASIKEAGQ